MPKALCIRSMTRPEVDVLVDWAAAEGWNPGSDDAELFWANDPETFVAAKLEGKQIGGGAHHGLRGRARFHGLLHRASRTPRTRAGQHALARAPRAASRDPVHVGPPRRALPALTGLRRAGLLPHAARRLRPALGRRRRRCGPRSLSSAEQRRAAWKRACGTTRGSRPREIVPSPRVCSHGGSSRLDEPARLPVPFPRWEGAVEVRAPRPGRAWP